MFVNGSGRNEQSLQRTFHRCFLPSFGSFGQAVSEEKIFRNRPIRNKNCLWRPCLSMDRDELSTLYRGPPIDVSVHLTKRFQRRILKISQSETSRLWWPCLLTDRDELSNLYRVHRCFLPSFGSFGQAVSEEKIFKNLYRDNCILNTDIYI